MLDFVQFFSDTESFWLHLSLEMPCSIFHVCAPNDFSRRGDTKEWIGDGIFRSGRFKSDVIYVIAGLTALNNHTYIKRVLVKSVTYAL